MEQITFYHATDPYGFFSNFALAPITIDGVVWPTSEHYYQAQKFTDPAQQEAIRRASTPGDAKALAWAPDARPRADWNDVRDDVMLVALRAKFTQHADLCARLLATGDAPLAEHTTNDFYWGDGGDGSGRNRLGEMLMQVRSELAGEAADGINLKIVDWLFDAGKIDLRRGSFFDAAPPAFGRIPQWERVEGMLLGLAIGDALGNTSESQSPAHRRAAHGIIRDYLPNRHAGGRAVGLPSDDSQLAFRLLEQLNQDRRFVPEHLAQRISSQQIFGLGSTMREFLGNYTTQKLPWYNSGPHSAGNGAIMRVAPILIPYLHAPRPELWSDTALTAMLTHNDSASTAACVAFIAILWDLLGHTEPPTPTWWLDRYMAVARELETGAPYQPRGGRFVGESKPAWQYVVERVADAYAQNLSVLEACEAWHSGAYLLETLPCVLYILMRHGDDIEEALVRAVNDTRDNDSVASLVGTALGALHGVSAIPVRWRNGLAGRLGAADDGALFALLKETRRIWFG